MALTKIIASIGPSSWDAEMLTSLAEAGMNIARFNFSHADYQEATQTLQRIRALNEQGYTITTMLDTKGPEIRTGDLDTPLQFVTGEQFVLTSGDVTQVSGKALGCDYPYLAEDVQVGQTIIIDSGLFPVKVIKIDGDQVIVEAQNNATIKSRRHINLPGTKLRLPALTEKDKKDIAFGIEQGMNCIAVSFARSGENIREVREYVATLTEDTIPLIAKIENQEALENLEAIVKESDGVMIARGDLGIEIDIVSLPAYQQQITKTCAQFGTPVIYATELLKSMVNNSFPTRAEVSDVYHAVAAGHDAIMLSDETAIGDYPVESVKMLKSLAESAEAHTVRPHDDFVIEIDDPYRLDKKYSAKAAHALSDYLDARAMIIFSRSGFFARLTAAYMPNVPVYGFTPCRKTMFSMNLLYGIRPMLMESEQDQKKLDEAAALQQLLDQGHISLGDKVIIAYDGEAKDSKVANIKIVQAR